MVLHRAGSAADGLDFWLVNRASARTIGADGENFSVILEKHPVFLRGLFHLRHPVFPAVLPAKKNPLKIFPVRPDVPTVPTLAASGRPATTRN